MATKLTSSYKYIGRSNKVSCPNGYDYRVLLYAKTSPNIPAGKHKVTVKQVLACVNNSTFHNWKTSGSVKVGDISAFSWSKEKIPLNSWGDSSSITAGDYTYKRHTVLKEGSVDVYTDFKETTITISSLWQMNDTNDAEWFPYQTVAECSVDVVLSAIATASVPTVSASNVVMGNTVTITTNRKSDSFTHTLTYEVGNKAGTIKEDVEGSYKWEVPWFSNIKNANCKIFCKTYSEDEQVGSTTVVNITIAAPAASQLTFSDKTPQMGQEITIYTNRANANLTHDITYSFGSKTGTIGTKAGASCAWTAPDLAEYCNNATSGSLTITCKTYNGTALIGTTSRTDPVLSVPAPTVPTVDKAFADLGTAVKVSTPRKSSNFTHKVTYQFGGQKYLISESVQTDCDFTFPLDHASLIPTKPSDTCTIYCDTYNGTALVGTETVTLTLKVPDNETTKPTFTYTLAPKPDDVVTSGFIDRVSLAGKYVKMKSKLVATFEANSKYSTIASYSLKVDGVTKTATTGSITSDYISNYYGTLTVTLRVTDARGYYTEIKDSIRVLNWEEPYIDRVGSNSAVVCERQAVNTSIENTVNYDYLRIAAKRVYTKMAGENVLTNTGFTQGNLCTLRYCYKNVNVKDSAYSDWVNLIYSGDLSTDEFDGLAPDSSGNRIQLSKTDSYDVWIQIYDATNAGLSMHITVPTDEVALHLGAGGKKAAFGKYAETENALEVSEDWDFYALGDAFVGRELTALGNAVVFGNLVVDSDAFLKSAISEEVSAGSASVTGNTETGSLTIGGNAVADYIVDIGHEIHPSGEWRWRKWNSGTYDIYGFAQVSPTESYAADNGVSYSELLYVPLPFAVNSGSFVAQGTANYAWAINLSADADNQRIRLRVMRAKDVLSSDNYNFRIIGHGRWK